MVCHNRGTLCEGLHGPQRLRQSKHSHTLKEASRRGKAALAGSTRIQSLHTHTTTTHPPHLDPERDHPPNPLACFFATSWWGWDDNPG